MNNQYGRGGRHRHFHGRGRGGRGRGGWRGGGGGGGRGGHRDNNQNNRKYGSNNFHHNNNRNSNNNRRGPEKVSGSSGDFVHYIESSGTPTSTSFTVAVQGCSHGELDSIYDALQSYQTQKLQAENPDMPANIDVLICCGDVQTLRNPSDFHALNVPPKYKAMGDFHAYYSGQKVAPILTIMIGGNHESSNYLQELYYGGWVAPNIWYMGAAGVINICKKVKSVDNSTTISTLRIAGLSGIYNHHHYSLGRFETPPYDKSSLRSVYHIRHADVQRLKALATPSNKINSTDDSTSKAAGGAIDIMISHDWPRGIAYHGNTSQLLQRKPFFREEVESNTLGNPANEMLLHELKPRYWFAAHLHVKFEAVVKHGRKNTSGASSGDANVSSMENKPATDKLDETTEFIALESNDGVCPDTNNMDTLTDQMTRFLSLDKCLPKRRHIQVLHVEGSSIVQAESASSSNDEESPLWLEYDPSWLSVLRRTHNWSQLSRGSVNIPEGEFEQNPISMEEVEDVRIRFQGAWERRRCITTNNSDNTNSNNVAALDNAMTIPQNFAITTPPYDAANGQQCYYPPQPMCGNPQTDEFLDILGLDHRITVPFSLPGGPPPPPPPPRSWTGNKKVSQEDDNEIDLDDGDEELSKNQNINDSVVNEGSRNEPKEDPSEIDLDALDEEEDEAGDQVCFAPRKADGTQDEDLVPIVKKPRVED